MRAVLNLARTRKVGFPWSAQSPGIRRLATYLRAVLALLWLLAPIRVPAGIAISQTHATSSLKEPVPSSGPAAGPKAKNVLILFRFFSPIGSVTDLIESSIRAHFNGPVTCTAGALDLEDPRLEKEPYQKTLGDLLRQKYSSDKPDVVIAVDYTTVELLTRYRDKIFPGRSVPIVFYGVASNWLEGRTIWPGATGVVYPGGVRDTIDLALRLHPDANTFAVIAGSTAWEKNWMNAIHSELSLHHDHFKEIDIVGPPGRQMLEQVGSLPPHTVVLFVLTPRTEIKSEFTTWDVLAVVSKRLPTYTLHAWDGLGHGIVGGAYYDEDRELRLTGEIAARVLSGERAEDIPVVYDSRQFQVDWRELQHWHIPESALPTGTLVLYREPTLWERGRKYFLAAIAAIVLQALLIFGLFWQRARKRKAEAVLRESEERFRVMANSTPSLIWMCDEKGKIFYLNDQRVAFTGSVPSAGYGDEWTSYIHPDDLENVQDALAGALKNRQRFSQEYRLRRHDGIYRWMLDIASPRVNGDGSFAGFIGSAIDITDQKLAQEALQTVGGRLLEAQDGERKRIARELHDDISQKLALLSMELAQANRNVNGSPEVTKAHLEEIRQHCSEIAKDIQSLSHQLHYSKLDYLGLVGALKGFCREFGKQYEVGIDFKDENVPRQLPRNISLCLFRVAQEALHNAVKYSGTREYTVRLSATGDELRLVVGDGGAGFDVAAAMRNQGLGLVSMQERMHLVNGHFHVESEPGEGTTIVATVPVITGGSSVDAGHSQATNVPGAA